MFQETSLVFARLAAQYTRVRGRILSMHFTHVLRELGVVPTPLTTQQTPPTRRPTVI